MSIARCDDGRLEHIIARPKPHCAAEVFVEVADQIHNRSMQPTKLQYLIAAEWPWQSWVVFASMACGIGTAWRIDAISDAGSLEVLWYAVLAALGGFLFAIFVVSAVFAPIYKLCARRNGAPFYVGDTVRILAGRYRGRIVRVYFVGSYSAWSMVYVELGDAERENFKDRFLPHQLQKLKLATENGLNPAPRVVQ